MMSRASSGLVKHRDVATVQAAFNVDVKLAPAATVAAAADEVTHGETDGVVGTVLAAATTTLTSTVDVGGTEGSHSRMEQLEENVDKFMQKMGIHGNTALPLLFLDHQYSIMIPTEFKNLQRRIEFAQSK